MILWYFMVFYEFSLFFPLLLYLLILITNIEIFTIFLEQSKESIDTD